MKLIKELTRDEMKNIMAGEDNICRVFVNGEWSCGCFTVSEANSYYELFYEVSGYCCESCGDEGFENADPCPEVNPCLEPEVA